MMDFVVRRPFAAILVLCSTILAAPSTQPAVSYPANFADAVSAIPRLRVSPGMQVSLFAAEPQLSNPVCFAEDTRGRFWVVETNRFAGGGTIDVREIMSWMEDELACRTVEDRVAAVKKNLTPDQVAAMQVNPDRIRLLEDTKGVGYATKATIWATGFNSLADGIAAGILPVDDKIYFADIPNLWVLRDDKHTGKSDTRVSLAYGFGVHYAHTGHDLHGLIWGPDGKLYMSLGDRGMHVVNKEGKLLDMPDTGGVLRCDPDGSNLEIFATGLRNPQELAFNEYGDLFSGDNNSDLGDPARFVHVVEGSDSGWRIGYQHLHFPNPTGLWLGEGMTNLAADNHCYAIIPPVAHIAVGPSGLAYYPGTGGQEQLAHHFLLCDFRGGPANSGIHSFSLKPRGASYDLAEQSQFVWNVVPTDVLFGNDGNVYFTDWTAGFIRPNKGRIYRVGDPAVANSAIVLATKKLIEEGMENRPLDELGALLNHPDMRIRQTAQFELASRGESALPLLTKTAVHGDAELARIHAIWALGQITRKSAKTSAEILPLLDDSDPEIRAQSARVLGDVRAGDSADKMIRLLKDSSPRVRLYAAIALSRIHVAGAFQPLLDFLRENADKDAYLRHAAVMALANSYDTTQLLTAKSDPSPSIRMGILLALRRQGRAEVGQFLSDSDPAIVLEAARAINDAPIDPAMPNLAALLTPDAHLPKLLLRRAINANFRLGTAPNALAVAQFAARSDSEAEQRIEALNTLAEWTKPSNLDHITGLWRPLSPRDPAIAAEAIRPVLASILRTAPDNIRLAAMPLARQVSSTDPNILSDLVADSSRAPALRAAALDAMAALNDPRLREIATHSLTDHDANLRSAAIALQPRFPGALPRLAPILESGSLSDKQAVFTTLSKIISPESDKILTLWLDRLKFGSVSPEIQLDLLESAGASKSPIVQAKLSDYQIARSKDDPLQGYRECLFGGDASIGRQIFREKAETSCMRCHRVGGEGGHAAPDLTHVASHSTREYLLESIVYPNRQIAAGFENVTLTLKDGKTINAMVKSETDSTVSLELPDQPPITIEKSDIVKRTRGLSPMPEGFGTILSHRELRSLVEFLAEQK